MIDLLFVTHNRKAFTEASLEALERNTNWDLVGTLHIYDDNSTDGTREFLRGREYVKTPEMHLVNYGSSVQGMRDYLIHHRRHSIFGKIDSDTMVPPGWLDQCFDVMERHPELDLLGIEAMNPVSTDVQQRGYIESRFIGGIGLMRASAFDRHSLPAPYNRYFGFTEWQERNPRVKKGWINPSLPVFLLDRFPFDPWRALSLEYCEKFGQRDWGAYSPESTELWSWWKEAQVPA
jgi:GT2 family glycosyltransferase